MSKIVLVTVAAAAYVLGAKAGRERYEQISEFAQRWWNDPRVRRKRSEASEAVKDRAPEAKEKLSGAAKHAADKVTSSGSDDAPTNAHPTNGTNNSAATGTG